MLCVDVGSTYTKGALIDPDGGLLIDRCSVPTTTHSDVWDGVRHLREELAVRSDRTPSLEDRESVYLCSSAGGGLRLAVVGFEREVTAVAARMVALSAGATIVASTSGRLRPADVEALVAARPDLILLVGGTDGGNADIVLDNAAVLAEAAFPAAFVVACNIDAAQQAAHVLRRGGGAVMTAQNVLPRIGQLAPTSARAAIRRAFLEHVIGGKGLSADPRFVAGVRAATPDAVLDGVQVLRDISDGDVMVIDIGGATTDIYSALQPQGEDAGLRKNVVGDLWTARTVEGDLGMRHSAVTVLAAASREGLAEVSDPALQAWAEEVHTAPHLIAASPSQKELDLRIAAMCAVIAARRHARPAPGSSPRPLAEVSVLIGSGGVLRHADIGRAAAVLDHVKTDLGGGWHPPTRAESRLDTAYVLGAVGLLARDWPQTAAGLAHRLMPTAQER